MNSDPQQLFDYHSQVKENSITKRRFHHEDVLPLIMSLDKPDLFEVEKIGSSFEQRDIYSIKIGKGKTRVLLWSQMHGNEPTATMALLDIFNFFKQNDSFADFKEYLLDKLTIYFIPMLNPDGINRYQRRNALGIDLNRDAVALQSPESQILKSFRDKIDADFGFNLHDQGNNHGVGNSGNPATISFLAPPVDHIKSINYTREKAIKLISSLRPIVESFIPGHIGSYSDDFEPRAFGDNIQKAGTSTVLIESGGYKDDPEKQFVRKINFTTILSAFDLIASEEFQDADPDIYFSIPKNEKRMFDLVIRNARLNPECSIDIGINHTEKELPDQRYFYYHSIIEDLGDLTGFYGYEEFDAQRMYAQLGAVYPQIFTDLDELSDLNALDLIRKGYTSVKIKPDFDLPEYVDFPLHIITKEPKPEGLKIEQNPNFLLYENDQVRFAIINGFLIDTNSGEISIPNSIIE